MVKMVRTVNSDCWQHLGSSCSERLEMPEESATQSTKINISLETCLNFYRCEQSTMTLVINISSKIVSEFSDVTHSNTKVRYLDGTPNKHSFLLSRKLFFLQNIVYKPNDRTDWYHILHLLNACHFVPPYIKPQIFLMVKNNFPTKPLHDYPHPQVHNVVLGPSLGPKTFWKKDVEL